MQKLRKIGIALAFLAAAGLAAGATARIGEKEITVPAPEGFEAVEADTPILLRFVKSIVGPQNNFLATFVPPEIRAEAKASGGAADLGRYFSAQTMTSMVDTPVSAVGFAQMRGQLVAQNEKVMKQITEKIPEVVDEVTGKLEEELLVDAEIEMGAMVPFKPHYQTERAFAFSMLINAKVSLGGGEQKLQRSSATLSFVHIHERVVFLYSFGNADDLEWTRDTGKAWTESFLLANGVAADKVAEAPRTEARSGSSSIWKNALIYGIIGGLIGAVFGVVKKITASSKRDAA